MTGSQAPHTCFVISPIGEEGTIDRTRTDKVLRHLIRKTLQPPEFHVVRGDQDNNPGLVTPSIIASLSRADLIIADLSDLNPNVYYELAVAHSMAKPVIHIRRIDQRLPFDLKDLRTISYDLTDPDQLDDARTQLYESVVYALAHPDQIITPLSGAERLIGIRASNNPIAESQADMATAVNDLRLRLGRDEDDVLRAVGELRSELRDGFALITRGFSTDFEPAPGELVDEPAGRLGIRRISLDGTAGAEMAEQIEQAGRIRIMSTSAVRLVDVHQRAITQALVRGCDLALLLPEPNGEFVRDVEEIEESDIVRYSGISREIAEVEDRLRAMLVQSLGERATLPDVGPPRPRIQIGHFTTQLRCTMVLCDDSWGWLTLTLPPLRSVETASFELVAAGPGSLLAACVTHFGAVWDTVEQRHRVRRVRE